MPERLGHVAAYGAFHLSRLWLGLIYYFFPIWAWIRSDGLVLFAEAQARSIDALELPPGSFLLTDPLLLGLAGMGVVAIRDRGRAALLIGLAIPPALMLCAISMAHRYRMEFYSCLFLAALFGLIVREWQGDKGQGHKGARNALGHKGVIAACVAIGIAASHAMAVVYVWSPAGPAEFYLERYGLIGTYTRPPR